MGTDEDFNTENDHLIIYLKAVAGKHGSLSAAALQHRHAAQTQNQKWAKVTT